MARHMLVVTSDKCVHCYRCVDNCPEEGCLTVEFLGKKLLSSKYRCQCDETEART